MNDIRYRGIPASRPLFRMGSDVTRDIAYIILKGDVRLMITVNQLHKNRSDTPGGREYSYDSGIRRFLLCTVSANGRY